MKRALITAVLTIVAAASIAGQGRPAAGPKLRVQPGNAIDRYIVTLRSDAAGPLGRASRAGQVAQAIGLTHGVQPAAVFSHALNGFSASMPLAKAEAISRDPRVEYVEQVIPVSGGLVQSSPANWGLDRIDQHASMDGQYHYSNDGAGVTAYMVDSGIRISHAEFGGRASYGPNFDRTSTGPSTDCSGHGTAMASVLGGATVGVAKGVSLIAVRVLDCNSTGYSDDLLSAIDWVTNDHMSRGTPAVANLSMSSGPISTSFTAWEDAIANSMNAGVTWTLIAGNNNDWVFNYSPGRMDGAITVGAVDETDHRAWFSNYGPQVDVYAPGTNITAASNASDSAFFTGLAGTSLAAPFAAGVAARQLQYQSWAPPGHIRNWMTWQATSDAIPDPGPSTPNLLLYSRYIDDSIAAAVVRGVNQFALVLGAPRQVARAIR